MHAHKPPSSQNRRKHFLRSRLGAWFCLESFIAVRQLFVPLLRLSVPVLALVSAPPSVMIRTHVRLLAIIDSPDCPSAHLSPCNFATAASIAQQSAIYSLCYVVATAAVFVCFWGRGFTFPFRLRLSYVHSLFITFRLSSCGNRLPRAS